MTQKLVHFRYRRRGVLICLVSNRKQKTYHCTALEAIYTGELQRTRKFSPPTGGFFLAPAEGCSLRLQRWGPLGPKIGPFAPT